MTDQRFSKNIGKLTSCLQECMKAMLSKTSRSRSACVREQVQRRKEISFHNFFSFFFLIVYHFTQ